MTEVFAQGPGCRLDLVYPSHAPGSTEQEEVICHVQGYAVRVNLPPLTSRSQYVLRYIDSTTLTRLSHRLSKNPRTAKQSVVVSGLGSEAFDRCARAILEVHAKLAAALPPGTLEEWKPIMDEGKICLEFSNRYFAVSSDGENLHTVSLSSEIDPFGLLAEAVPDGRHTEDNQVLYYDRIVQEKR